MTGHALVAGVDEAGPVATHSKRNAAPCPDDAGRPL